MYPSVLETSGGQELWTATLWVCEWRRTYMRLSLLSWFPNTDPHRLDTVD